MIRISVATAAFVAVLGWTAAAQDARSVIAEATAAMGAGTVKTLQYSGPASEFAFGQAFSRTSAWPVWRNKSYTRTIDFETPALRIDRVAEPTDPQRRGGGLRPAATQTIIVNAGTTPAQQIGLALSPYGFLKAAAASGATLASQTVEGRRYRVLTFTGPNKAKVNGYVNDQGLVERVETWLDHAVLGDTSIDASFSGFRDVNGVKVPTRIIERQGGHPTLDLTIAEAKINEPANIQPPQGRGGAGGGGQAGGQAPAATSRQLAEGGFLILPAYAVLAVDFGDHIVVVESGQNEARASAIIAEAKRVIPNKPIRYVVNTHGHFDHSSGLRTFVAEGATIITHQGNTAYFEKVLALPHTLNPDRLQRSPARVVVEGVGDKHVLTGNNKTIELHRLQGDLHDEGHLVAYLPKEKVLLEADGFLPPAQMDAQIPNAVNPTTLVENINRLKLDVETVIPVHYAADGRTVTMAELAKRARDHAALAGL